MSVIPATRPGGVALGCRWVSPMNWVKTRSCGGSIRPELRPCHRVSGSWVYRGAREHAFLSACTGLGHRRCGNATFSGRLPLHYARIYRSGDGCECRTLGYGRLAASRDRSAGAPLGFQRASRESVGLYAPCRISLPLLPVLFQHAYRNRVRVRLTHCGRVRVVRRARLARRWLCNHRRCSSRGVARHASKVLRKSVSDLAGLRRPQQRREP